MLLQGIGAQQWPHQSVQDKAQRSSLSFRFVHGTVTGAAVVSFTVKLSRTVVHGWYHCTLFCSFSYTKLQNMSLGEWDSGGSTAGAVMVLKVHRSLVLRFWPAGHVPSKQWQPAFLLFFFFFFFFLELQQHWVCLYLVNMDFEHTYVTSVAVPVLHGPLFPKDLRLSGGSHEIFFFFLG